MRGGPAGQLDEAGGAGERDEVPGPAGRPRLCYRPSFVIVTECDRQETGERRIEGKLACQYRNGRARGRAQPKAGRVPG